MRILLVLGYTQTIIITFFLIGGQADGKLMFGNDYTILRHYSRKHAYILMRKFRCSTFTFTYIKRWSYVLSNQCVQEFTIKSWMCLYVCTYILTCMYVSDCESVCLFSSSSFVRLVCTLNMSVSALCLYIRIRVYLPKFLHMHTYTKNTRVHTYTSLFMKPLSIILK